MLDAVMRAGQRDDVPALVALMAEFHDEAGFRLRRGAAAEALVTLIDNPRLGAVWLVERDGAPAGYLVLTLGFSMECGGVRGFVDDFYVRPSARGGGVGAAMLATVADACKGLGVRALAVAVGPHPDRARRLYGRAGFTDSGRILMSLAFAAPIHDP